MTSSSQPSGLAAGQVERDPARRDAIERSLELVAFATAVAAAAAFPVAALGRLAYPFELEWLESEMLQHTVRVLAGQPIHAAPAAAFSPTIYPPVYAWLSALVAKLVGATFLAPRLVSVASLTASALLIGLIAHRLSGSWRGGAVAAALLFAAYVPCGTFFDLARLDPLWVLLLLAASAAAATADTVPRAMAAGALAAAATATKQPAALFAVVFAAALVPHSRKAAAALLATFGALTAAYYGALHLATDGWSTIYTVLIPARVPHKPGAFVPFIRDDVLRNYAPAVILLTLWALAARPRAASRPGHPLPIRWWLAAACAALATVSMRTLQGGGLNTLLPLIAFGALMTGAVVGQLLRHGDRPIRIATLVALGCQFAMLLYNPLNVIPKSEDRARAEALVARVRSYPGPVWIPSHTSYAHLAGKPFQVHRDPLLDLLYSGWDAFPQDLLVALRRGAFDAIILDGPFAEAELQETLEQHYRLADTLTEAPTPATGYATRPTLLYEPAER